MLMETEEVKWTVELEVAFFRSMSSHKPVGELVAPVFVMSKNVLHFFMAVLVSLWQVSTSTSTCCASRTDSYN